MPTSRRGGRGRSAIYNWRVKAGNREVFSNPQKGNCAQWIRDNQASYPVKLRLIPPNF